MDSNFLKPHGEFKIECLDKNGNIIDVFHEKNIIVDLARKTMANSIAGFGTNKHINKLILGTNGHIDGDILQPKSTKDGFVATRTSLFTDTSTQNSNKFNTITFTPSGSDFQTRAENIKDGANNNSTVDITVLNDVTSQNSSYTVSYVFMIDLDAFNGTQNGVCYTEAGLYSDDNLFAMRTFKGKIKDNSVSLKITWNIIF